jgi:hypothetical protein
MRFAAALLLCLLPCALATVGSMVYPEGGLVTDMEVFGDELVAVDFVMSQIVWVQLETHTARVVATTGASVLSPRGVAVVPQLRRLFVAMDGGSIVTMLLSSSGPVTAVVAFSSGAGLRDIDYSPDANMLFWIST